MVRAWRVSMLGGGWGGARWCHCLVAPDVASTRCRRDAKDSLRINGTVSPAHGRTTRRNPRDVGRVPSKWVVIPTIVGAEDDQVRDGSSVLVVGEMSAR